MHYIDLHSGVTSNFGPTARCPCPELPWQSKKGLQCRVKLIIWWIIAWFFANKGFTLVILKLELSNIDCIAPCYALLCIPIPQRRSQNFPVGGDDEILANWQIEMLRYDVCSIVRERFGVGFSGGLHLIWSYLPTV